MWKTEAIMKKGYKIGLFFALLLIILLIILIVCKRAVLRNQMPGRTPEQNIEMENVVPDSNSRASASSQNLLRTTCDTICIYEDIDKKDGTIVISQEKIPGKYIDMTRSELELALYDDSKFLSLEDKEKGFISQHLELFSGEQVKIVRIYDTTVEEVGYYIMAVEQEIWIFKEDKETIFFKTDLIVDELPKEVQQEVLEGKYMDSEIKVYHFLESYSS